MFNPAGGATRWQTFTLDFIALAPSAAIAFVGASGGQYIGLDNVQVAPVPEPSSLALLGAATAAAAARRRRRSSRHHCRRDVTP
jgi:hypothetical protein